MTYTTEDSVQVAVRTDVEHAETATAKTTNTFHFTFRFANPIRKQIMPRLYDEAMKVVLSLIPLFCPSSR